MVNIICLMLTIWKTQHQQKNLKIRKKTRFISMCKPTCFDIARSFLNVGLIWLNHPNMAKTDGWTMKTWFIDFDAEFMGKPTILWDQPNQFYGLKVLNTVNFGRIYGTILLLIWYQSWNHHVFTIFSAVDLHVSYL